MKHFRVLLCALPLFAAPSLVATDVQACGGCMHPTMQVETTQVTGHRMILSISPGRTTLWDQIKFSGDPQSFAWVLPIKGTVDVGLSSDALFQQLEDSTQVIINSPEIPPCPLCSTSYSAASSGSGDGGAGGSGSGVIVIAEQVVGPYETVQLSSQDPNALRDWLLNNGYALPPDIAPIVDTYVAEGFNFLAMKLAPAKGIDSMRPVRVTSTGATPVLPLRMVAAGTGVTTPITLWIMGEGRYEPANFQSFTIKESDLTWNWATRSSNYTTTKLDAFAASQGKSWLIESADGFSKYNVESNLYSTIEYNPASSGYGGDPNGPTPLEECNADLDMLWGTIPDNTLWVTRMHGDLSRAALGTDLNVQISADQSRVNRILNVKNTIGSPPSCPPCGGISGSGGSGGIPVDINPWDDDVGSGHGKPVSASCAVSAESGMPTALGLLGAASALSFVRKRARRASRKRSS